MHQKELAKKAWREAGLYDIDDPKLAASPEACR